MDDSAGRTDTSDLEAVEKERLKQNERLLKVLGKLEGQVARQASFKLAFVRGVVYGLGTVIGATVLIAILGGILAGTVDSLRDWPVVGGWLESASVEEYIEEAQ